MNTINTIDLWTEAKVNHYECFNGAFVDGFEDGKVPYNKYKVVRNCNCIISVSLNYININNKHHAIIFYNDDKPVRLLVINKDTNVDKCIDVSLKQFFDDALLSDAFDKYGIVREDIDLQEEPIISDKAQSEEIDVGSCDRWSLLYNMLKGLYTESDTEYGNFSDDKYYFIPDLLIKYDLTINDEHFEIVHKCAFINDIKSRIIPIQENSLLTEK